MKKVVSQPGAAPGHTASLAPATMQDLFMVLATENPIEQEGTYPLPEAQLNRAENAQSPKSHAAEPAAVAQQAIFDARAEIDNIFVSDLAQKYMVDLIYATRFPDRYGEPLNKWIQIGASPRGPPPTNRQKSCLP
jgi:MoxR-like ATPase